MNGLPTELVVVSGLSGSGKTVALHTLEDEGYHCIDNLSPGLLRALVLQWEDEGSQFYDRVAVGIDARSNPRALQEFPALIEDIRNRGIEARVVFLRANAETLLKRFSETRRRHPLTRRGLPLLEAIDLEHRLLAEIADTADLTIATSDTHIHQLRALIRERVVRTRRGALSLLFQSFGYKHGVPSDSDFVFDARCLPNPNWQAELRPLTGRDAPVRAFLEGHPSVARMTHSIAGFLESWIPHFQAEGRRYLTVSIGCTGGQHRSVYMTETLADRFRDRLGLNVALRHRELGSFEGPAT